MRQKVAVGLSGGVDSAVAAALLVRPSFAQGYGRARQGYDATGVFLVCWREPGCRTDEDRKDALAVALKLKIPFKVLDFRKEYKAKVVDYFYSEYKAGRTPNPDVMCNQEIKFGLFYEWALRQAQGLRRFDFVATGHYARIEEGKLLRSVDEKKDQSYFLYRLRPEQLGHILFPVGELTKTQVRQEARRRGLPVAEKPDSQGICFIGPSYAPSTSLRATEGKGIKGFLKKLGLKEKMGEVVDTKGKVIGEHDGVWFYTIGQRHGFRTSGGRPPMYVIDKNVKKNRLVVGFGPETYRNGFEIGDIHWIKQPKVRKSLVRIRHLGKLIECVLEGSRVKLREPQRGIAPGQSAVFYDGEVCLGGGIIQ